MEHRLGAALRSGSSVLTAVISDNTALHTAIHTAIQVAEGHQLTTGARKLANFSSLKYYYKLCNSTQASIINALFCHRPVLLLLLNFLLLFCQIFTSISRINLSVIFLVKHFPCFLFLFFLEEEKI